MDTSAPKDSTSRMRRSSSPGPANRHKTHVLEPCNPSQQSLRRTAQERDQQHDEQQLQEKGMNAKRAMADSNGNTVPKTWRLPHPRDVTTMPDWCVHARQYGPCHPAAQDASSQHMPAHQPLQDMRAESPINDKDVAVHLEHMHSSYKQTQHASL